MMSLGIDVAQDIQLRIRLKSLLVIKILFETSAASDQFIVPLQSPSRPHCNYRRHLLNSASVSSKPPVAENLNFWNTLVRLGDDSITTVKQLNWASAMMIITIPARPGHDRTTRRAEAGLGDPAHPAGRVTEASARRKSEST